jgi:putative transposase
MNARDYKLFRSGYFYHVYNRGNHKDEIFLDNQDYIQFEKRLRLVLNVAKTPFVGQRESLPVMASSRLRIRPLSTDAFTIVSYCFMPNHFHFLIKQNTNLGINHLIAKLCTSYVKYFNSKYEKVGHLFQDAFKAKLVDSESYLTYLSAYIHTNPLNPMDYKYSSFQDYIGIRHDTITDTRFLLNMFRDRQSYIGFVNSFGSRELNKIRFLLFEE